MKKQYFFFALMSIPFFSCQTENISDIELQNKVIISDANVKVENKRFVFKSREDLKTTIEGYKNEEPDFVSSQFEKLYKSGFRSLKPIVNPKNRDLIEKISLEKNQMKKGYDSLEQDIIFDPYLAALVNEDNEIIVNDSLYKFTPNKGLFFAHVKDSSHLVNYVQNLESTKYMAQEPCLMRLNDGGYTQVDTQITRYISPIDDCSGGGGGGGGYTPPPSVPSISEEERLQKVVDNLPQCDGNAGGNWVQNSFGDSFVCRSYFDGDHRIKTEFWNQGFGFYESIGVQVKTQVKTLGIWWASDSDEIYLGINKILLKYDFPQPQINSYTPTGLPSINVFRAPIYMYNGKIKVFGGIYNGYEHFFSEIDLSVTKNPLPFFQLDNEDILNIYIPNLPIIDDYELNLTTGDIASQSNIKALYKMGIDFLRKEVGSGTSKEFVVTYQNSYNEIETIYFAERYSNTDDHHIERKFYKDGGIAIKWVWGGSGGGTYSVEPVTDYYRNYTHYEIDFYGMARRGNTWRGNRMITVE